VEFILEHGTPELLNYQETVDKRTPLYIAANHGSLIVETMLLKGANPNITNSDGNSGLHQAAPWNELECCKLLVQYGVKINHKNTNGYTALDLAVYLNKKECAQYLHSQKGKCNKFDYPKEWLQ
jgi:ankyrin repeat protein